MSCQYISSTYVGLRTALFPHFVFPSERHGGRFGGPPPTTAAFLTIWAFNWISFFVPISPVFALTLLSRFSSVCLRSVLDRHSSAAILNTIALAEGNSCYAN